VKPYFVTLAVVAVVMADSRAEASAVAQEHRSEIFRDVPPADIGYVVGSEINTQEDLSGIQNGGWSLDCIPYGGDGNTPLCDLLPA